MGGGFVEEILGTASVFGEFLELSIPIAPFLDGYGKRNPYEKRSGSGEPDLFRKF